MRCPKVNAIQYSLIPITLPLKSLERSHSTITGLLLVVAAKVMRRHRVTLFTELLFGAFSLSTHPRPLQTEHSSPSPGKPWQEEHSSRFKM